MMKRKKIGPTGKFPNGKLNDDDEGEIAFRVGSENGLVVIDFGKPVHWLGFPPGTALDLANLLIQHAKRAKK